MELSAVDKANPDDLGKTDRPMLVELYSWKRLATGFRKHSYPFNISIQVEYWTSG